MSLFHSILKISFYLECSLKYTRSDPPKDVSQKINIMNLVGMSNNISQLPNLCNPIKCLCNHINELCNMEGGVLTSINFVQIYLVDFENINVGAKKHIYNLFKFQ
jgi:hypothetical protein